MMDEYDKNVMAHGIHLSYAVHWFLAQNGRKLDQLADMGLLSRHDLDCLRASASDMETARIERLETARP